MKLAISTQANRAAYPLPDRVGEVLEVRHAADGIPVPILLLECPVTRSYIRCYSMNGAPQDKEEIINMLRRAHGLLTYRPLWYAWKRELIIWPPAPNDGEWLIVDYENAGITDGCNHHRT